MYKKFTLFDQDEGKGREYIICEAKIGEGLEQNYSKFTESEIFTILTDETRTILNMVPCDHRDIIKMNFNSSDYDPWQPLEILGGQSIIDYFLHDPEQVKAFCDKAIEEEERSKESKIGEYKKSILQIFLQDKGDEMKDYFTAECINRDKHEMSQDFLSSNPLRKCFDYDIKNQKSHEIDNSSSWKKFKKRCKDKIGILSELFVEKFDNEDLEEQEQKKLQAKHLKSAQYLVHHLLNKKNITGPEHKFVMISMNLMLDDGVIFGKFFHNIYEEGRFSTDELLKNRYCNLVEMNQLPEYAKDKHCIRLLGRRKWPLIDFDTD